jgi:transcriptional regulator with XRE-family HTH domain
MSSRSVPWLAGIDDDHRTSLTPELQCRRQSGGRATDDGNVALPLDGPWTVLMTHAPHDTVTCQDRTAPCDIRKTQQEAITVADSDDVERVVRTRLRTLRTTLGLSLDDLAARTNLSASTISRIETGRRTIGLDVLLPLARALQVNIDALLDVHSDDDVVIRPVASKSGATTTWTLSRPTAGTVAVKMRLQPTRRPPEQRVHPGHDWLFVLDGRVRLMLGDREIIVEHGEAAEFATMTPHALSAIDEPAEIIMIFDRDGHRAHVHQTTGGSAR